MYSRLEPRFFSVHPSLKPIPGQTTHQLLRIDKMKSQRKRDRLSSIFRRSTPSQNLATSSPIEPRQGGSREKDVEATQTSSVTSPITVGIDPEANDGSRSFAPGSNLWATAYERLATSSSVDERETAQMLQGFGCNADGASSDGEYTLRAVTEAAEKKRFEARARSSRIQIGERTIVLRDVAEKIVCWVDRFKEIGDQVVTYDPAHAALPWAAVRFILSASVINYQMEGEVTYGLERSLHAALRCRVYEKLYLSISVEKGRNEEIDYALTESIVSLYMTILSFLGLVLKYQDSTAAEKIASGILVPEKFSSVLSRLSNNEDHLEKTTKMCKDFLSQKSREYWGSRFDVLETLLTNEAKTIRRSVENIWQKLEQNETVEILKWISAVSHEDDLLRVQKTRLENTCEWLIAYPTYLEWNQCDESTSLWLFGIPGAGKTHLASKVVETSILQSQPTAYFFCDRNRESHRDPVDVLRSLCRQLSYDSRSGLLDLAAINVYRKKEQSGFSSNILTREECEKLLLKLVERREYATIVIDGLDESYQKTRGKELLKTIQNIMKNTSSVLKLFVSSRNEQDIRRQFIASPALEINTQNQDDIEMFVNEKMQENEWWCREIATSTKSQVIQLFREKSEGMFQWASLHIDSLVDLESDSMIIEWLKTLPKGLEKTYDKIFSEIDPRNRAYVDRACLWLMAAPSVLYPEDLGMLVCQDPEKPFDPRNRMSGNAILSLCRHLVRKTDFGCRFSHLSIREYLEQRRNVKGSDVYLLEILTGINFCTWAIGKEDVLHEVSGRVLSVCHFPMRASKHTGSLTDNLQVFHRVLDFLGSPACASDAFNRMYELRQAKRSGEEYRWEPSALPIYFCIEFGFYCVLEHWLKLKVITADETFNQVTSITFYGDLMRSEKKILPLQEAVKHDQPHILELFLQHGANPNITTVIEGYDMHEILLRHVCFSLSVQPLRRPKFTKLLLDYGASIGDPDDEDAETKAAFHMYKLGDWRTGSHLVDHGARIDYVDRYGCSALHHAAIGNDPDAVRSLIGYGLEVNKLDSREDTPLYKALRSIALIDPEVIRTLTQAGGNVHHTDSNGNTALHLGALYGSCQSDSIVALIKSGSNPNLANKNGYTPLHLAILKERSEIIRTLLEHGADADLSYAEGKTAVHLAAINCPNELRLLAEYDADVNRRANGGFSALHFAALTNKTQTYDLLLDLGADSTLTWEMVDGEQMLAQDLLNTMAYLERMGNELTEKVLEDEDSLLVFPLPDETYLGKLHYLGPIQMRMWVDSVCSKSESGPQEANNFVRYENGYFPGVDVSTLR